MSGRRTNLIAAGIYLAVMTAAIYGDWNRTPSDVTAWIATIAVLVANLALGATVRRWWAFLLPLALILIALPAGYGPPTEADEYSEEIVIPIWGWFIFYAPIFAVLIGAGRLGRWSVGKFRARSS